MADFTMPQVQCCSAEILVHLAILGVDQELQKKGRLVRIWSTLKQVDQDCRKIMKIKQKRIWSMWTKIVDQNTRGHLGPVRPSLLEGRPVDQTDQRKG